MNITQLNFAELENIQNIASGERCLAKTIANNILELNGVTPVIEAVLYPADESNQRRGNAGGNFVNGGKVNEISIYPNPANDFFQISLPEDNYIITVYNSTGQIVNVQASNTQAKMIIHTINYAEGLYLIKVEKDNFQQKFKVTIKH